MQKVLTWSLIALFFCMGLWWFSFAKKFSPDIAPAIQPPLPQANTYTPNTNPMNVVFMPYWTLEAPLKPNYTHYVFFSLPINEDGVKANSSLNNFIKKTSEYENRLITVSITNHAKANAFITDINLQNTVLQQLIELKNTYSFTGVVWDIEFSPQLFTNTVKDGYTQFIRNAQNQLTAHQLQQYVIVYGDTFYRARPYDVKKLAEYSSGVMVMAYDLYKSNSEAGPLFPYAGKEQYGYDMAQMVADMAAQAPQEKLIIINGMYGYEWQVDPSNNIPLKPGRAVTQNVYKASIKQYCNNNPLCRSELDEASGSTVFYYEKDNAHFVLWLNLQSAQERRANLEKLGILHVGYWAHGYF